MDIRDYEKILDAIPNTGIYVIREDNHEILYFNERIRRMAPNVEKGTACDRMWANSCSNCPLLHMGQRQEGKSIISDNALGTVDMARKKKKTIKKWGTEPGARAWSAVRGGQRRLPPHL